jgi:hypothetical protein
MQQGRNPVGQSQACVFNRSGTVWDLVKGNMRCVNLRLNANRSTLSNNGPNNGSRPGLFTPNGWLFFRHIGRPSNASFSQDGTITLVDPSVKIRERMNTWNLQSDNSFGSLATGSEAVIARF